MYQIISYVKKHGMGIHIRYDEDTIKIQVFKKDGVSTYAVDSIIYGIEHLRAEPNQIMFNRVALMVEQLERGVGVNELSSKRFGELHN